MSGPNGDLYPRVNTIERDMASYGREIATLREQMKQILGNGQPGRLTNLEVKVEGHSKAIWIGMGILAILQVLHANGILNIRSLFH